MNLLRGLYSTDTFITLEKELITELQIPNKINTINKKKL